MLTVHSVKLCYNKSLIDHSTPSLLAVNKTEGLTNFRLTLRFNLLITPADSSVKSDQPVKYNVTDFIRKSVLLIIIKTLRKNNRMNNGFNSVKYLKVKTQAHLSDLSLTDEKQTE